MARTVTEIMHKRTQFAEISKITKFGGRLSGSWCVISNQMKKELYFSTNNCCDSVSATRLVKINKLFRLKIQH